MLAEWSAECSEDAPTVVVPWTDAESGLHYVDLRENPFDIADIPEAEHNPALSRALRALNASRSGLLTAKCDAWAVSATDSADALETLRAELMLDPDIAVHGYASYIDILWRERSIFVSAHQQQDRLDRLVRRAQKLEHPEAVLECVLRPAFHEGAMTLEGFAVTLYVTALAPDPMTALARWEAALEDVTSLLRAKEFEVARGAATI